MSPRTKGLIGSLILIFTTCSVAFLIFQASKTTIVTGEVFDAENGMPVYGAKISVGNKTTKTFLLKKFRLTSLAGGKAQLTVTAPMYETLRKELDISKKISIDIPLRGKKIEGLTGVLVWDRIEEASLFLDVRLTNENGETMIYFPSMPFKADVKIYENKGTVKVPERGKPLYAGQPDIIDDPPKGLKRLKCKIALSEIAKPRQQGTLSILDFILRVQNDTFQFSRYDLNIGN